MNSLPQICADVQALARAYLILTEGSPTMHATERLGCRRILQESQAPGYLDGPSDRAMLLRMIRDVTARLASEQREQRSRVDQAEFQRIFG